METNPRVLHVCTVLPNIISIRLVEGEVVAGKHQPYEQQPGDTFEDTEYLQRWVKRDGKYLGCLNGKDRKTVYTNEQAVKEELDTEAADKKGSYLISSADDPAYTESVSPTYVYRKSKPADIARIGVFDWDPVLEHTIYLRLKTPLTEGKSYAVGFDFNNILRQSFTYDPAALRSEAVHVSHLGFKPDDPAKIAFLSCWMGTGGGIDYSEVRDFQVVEEAEGKEVLSGRLRIARRARENEDARDRNYNQADVYCMDLTGLDTPGRYRVVVKGTGAY